MSKSTSKPYNYNPLSADREASADIQRHNRRLPTGRWDNPQYIAGWEAVNLMRESEKLMVQTASDVVSESKTWIYPNWLALEEVTVLAGAPDVGKTALECALAAGVTQGTTCSLAPGLTPTGSGHVIIVNKEDSIAKSLKPRLEAAGADLSKVHFIGCKGGEGEDSSFSFSSERDMARLEGLTKVLGNNLGLIIIDPIYCVVDGDYNNNYKAREAYEGLARLAKRLTCAILGIAHTVRNPQNKHPLAQIAGPPALREVPRAVMLISKISSGPTANGGTHVLVHAKNNEGKSDGGFEFRITPVEIPGHHGPIETTKVVVTAELSGSADDILNEASRGTPSKPPGKLKAAIKLLEEVLAAGPRPRIEIEELAEEIDVSLATLINAKDSLNIVTKRRNGDGRSVWRLPDSAAADKAAK
jgi:putative DNA primase/helicase